MKKSFKEYKENRELMEFGQKYDHLCHLIAESGVSFDEFWINHGMPYVLSGAASTEEELIEGWNPASWDWKGLANNPTVQAAGTLGKSALSGAAQGIGAMGRMAGGALAGAAQGFGQSQLGKNIGGFFNPQQPQAQAQPNQAQQPQAQAQPQNLNQNQQQAATKALDAIKAELTKAMQNLANSGDPTTQKLSQQFRDKITKYMSGIKIKNGGTPQQQQQQQQQQPQPQQPQPQQPQQQQPQQQQPQQQQGKLTPEEQATADKVVAQMKPHIEKMRQAQQPQVAPTVGVSTPPNQQQGQPADLPVFPSDQLQQPGMSQQDRLAALQKYNAQMAAAHNRRPTN